MSPRRKKLITVVLPKGESKPLIKALVKEKGINQITVNYARGVGRLTPLRHRGIGETTEKEMVHIAVNRKDADELFEYIYYKARINRPHGGLMYMQSLLGATHFELPDIPEEEKDA